MRTRIATLLGTLVLLMAVADLQAFYNPGTGRWINRDPIDERGFTWLALVAQTAVADDEVSTETARLGGDNLYVFVGNDAIRLVDLLGLRWKVDRQGGARAPATPEAGDTVADLASLIGLNPAEYRSWLTPASGTVIPSSANQRLSACDKFEIPNTVVAYWAGDLGGVGRWWVRWNSSVRYLGQRGFSVDEDRHQAGNNMALHTLLVSKDGAKELHGLYFWGHGNTQFLASRGGDALIEYATLNLRYKMGLGLVFACDSNSGQGAFVSGTSGSIWRGFTGVLVPWPFRHYHPKHYIRPGQQETH
jgi:hypothetical protein